MYLHKGSTGQQVFYVSVLLGITPSNTFTTTTELAVRAFQKRNGLLADGIVGKKTFAKLLGNKVRDAGVKAVLAAKPKPSEPLTIKTAPNILTGLLTTKFVNNEHSRKYLSAGLDSIRENATKFQMEDSADLAHFLGQAYQEVGRTIRVVENLNYSAHALPRIFRFYRINLGLADKHGYTPEHGANQEAIANHAYSKRYGNGSPATGDGWKYRGRAFSHTTFYNNYAKQTKWIAKNLPGTFPDFTKYPDMAMRPEYALLFGAVYWAMSGASMKVSYKNTVTKQDSYAITKIYNSYTDSYNKRWSNTKIFAKILGVTVT